MAGLKTTLLAAVLLSVACSQAALAKRAAPPPKARPNKLGLLAVFGDSISDTGAGAALGRGPYPPSYWKDNTTYVEAGSAGNWVDEVARVARLPPAGIFNGAVGGATACKWDDQITFQQQADFFATYVAGKVPAGTTTAAVIMLGTNDWFAYFSAGNITEQGGAKQATSIAACIGAGIDTLVRSGAFMNSTIYVSTLEALERIPVIFVPAGKEGLPILVQAVDITNKAIRSMVDDGNILLKLYKVPVKLEVLDLTKALRAGFKKPPSPITIIDKPCLTFDDKEPTTWSYCTNQKKRAFVDAVHYSSLMQTKVIAPVIYSELRRDKFIN